MSLSSSSSSSSWSGPEDCDGVVVAPRQMGKSPPTTIQEQGECGTTATGATTTCSDSLHAARRRRSHRPRGCRGGRKNRKKNHPSVLSSSTATASTTTSSSIHTAAVPPPTVLQKQQQQQQDREPVQTNSAPPTPVTTTTTTQIPAKGSLQTIAPTLRQTVENHWFHPQPHLQQQHTKREVAALLPRTRNDSVPSSHDHGPALQQTCYKGGGGTIPNTCGYRSATIAAQGDAPNGGFEKTLVPTSSSSSLYIPPSAMYHAQTLDTSSITTVSTSSAFPYQQPTDPVDSHTFAMAVSLGTTNHPPPSLLLHPHHHHPKSRELSTTAIPLSSRDHGVAEILPPPVDHEPTKHIVLEGPNPYALTNGPEQTSDHGRTTTSSSSQNGGILLKGRPSPPVFAASTNAPMPSSSSWAQQHGWCPRSGMVHVHVDHSHQEEGCEEDPFGKHADIGSKTFGPQPYSLTTIGSDSTVSTTTTMDTSSTTSTAVATAVVESLFAISPRSFLTGAKGGPAWSMW